MDNFTTGGRISNLIRKFRCDLHIHTCLSPCGALEMYPRAIIEKALAAKLDLIGICDHNASENIGFVIKAAEGTSLKVLPGMEITSREEVHLLALFDTLANLRHLQDLVYEHLPGMNREEIFGCQAIVNDVDEVEGFNDRFLLGATKLSLPDIIRRIHLSQGLAIAAHIDRESFSVLGQLGFLDPGFSFDALEVTSRTGIRNARRRYPELGGYAFLESSDAHSPRDIGQGVTNIFLRKGTIGELKMAFAGRGGRYVAE